MRRALPAALAVAVAAGGGLAWAVLHDRPAPAAAVTAVPIGTARVVRTDIVSHQRVGGTLGYGSPWTITAPGGVAPEAVRQARAAVATGQAGLNAATQAARDADSAGQLAVGQAQAAAANAAPGPAQEQAQAELATARQHAGEARHQAEAQVATAGTELQGAQAALQAAESGARLDGTITWLPAAGAVVQQGQALYAVNGQPVPLLYGAQPAYRQLWPGTSGDDVRQLEQDLLALGFANASNLTANGTFTGADTAAVQRWQAALGVPGTGVLRLGDVVFAPGPVRVAAVRAALGAQAAPGAQVLDVTATRHVVLGQLDTSRQQLVHPGDQVSVLMPDGRTSVAGSVTDVSHVAASPSPGQGGGGQSGTTPATVAITVALADEAAAGALDQAPVSVSITTASRRGVLAVPVTALLAQPNGDYAVALRTGGGRRLVTVQPGLFGDGGLVEVGGAGLAAGQEVEVPAA